MHVGRSGAELPGDLAERLLRLDVVRERGAERLGAADRLPQRRGLQRAAPLQRGVRVLERRLGDLDRVVVAGLLGRLERPARVRQVRLRLFLAFGQPVESRPDVAPPRSCSKQS